MFDITLIAMGKLKEKFYLSAAAEYEKRMKGYCQFNLIELPEVRLPENPSHEGRVRTESVHRPVPARSGMRRILPV